MYCYIALLEVMDYPGGMAQGPATKMNPLGLNQLPFLYMYIMCQIVGVFILIVSMLPNGQL